MFMVVSTCPCVLICPPSKVTCLRGTCPHRCAMGLLKFQNKQQTEAWRERHVACAPTGERRVDYGGLWLYVILHFSSP